jgi:hypothetical protein
LQVENKERVDEKTFRNNKFTLAGKAQSAVLISSENDGEE